jgi:UDP-N-acetylmuramoyl-tripeptide--D-alanyl-D-alanine ligase
MIDLTVAEAAKVLQAELLGTGDQGALLTDLTIDSRNVPANALFVALPGERVNGHDYVEAAWSAGAAAAVTDRPVTTAAEPGLTLVVPDPLAAMGTLTRHLVDRATGRGMRVVGITGSQGKTSTKDLLAQLLERSAPTVAPRGNLNNEIGVPLTVSRIEPDTRFLVAEMGARGIGHIAYLCRLTPPEVGVVLNIGHAHLGEFGSQAAIAQTKGELVEALPTDGIAVLNADDPLVWAMRSRTAAATLGFSILDRPAADRAVWASDLQSRPDGCYQFVLRAELPHRPAVQLPIRLQLAGRHQVANAVAAAAAALALGLDAAEVAAGLNEAELRSRWRMETHLRNDQLLVVNDAYNANPDSMKAALETAAELGRARRVRHPHTRTWAVLGDMLELGESSATEHAAIGSQVAALGFDRLVAVGQFADEMAAGACAAGLDPAAVHAYKDKTGVSDVVREEAQATDTILVKASRGLALETVAEEILRDSDRSDQNRQPTDDSEDSA